MKEKLRNLGIKTTELSEFMRISRPSLYKYIELYESNEYKLVPEKVLRVFKYVDKYKNLSKEQVIAFTISEFSDTDVSDKKEAIRNYLLNKGANDPKINLMYVLATTESLDGIVQYLISAGKILDYGDYDESKIYQVARLVNLKSDIMTNKPLSEDEITKAKTIIGD